MFWPQTAIIKCFVYAETVAMYKIYKYVHLFIYVQMWCFLFNLLDVHSILICTDWFLSLSNLIFFNILKFLKII
jgi:hypothetical protein